MGDIFARIDARAAFPGVLAACRAWGPDVVVSEITEFAGPLAAELVGVPSVCVGISQQGKEERVPSPSIVDALDELRAASAWRPTPRGERLLGRPYFTLLPAALEDPATPARLRAQRFREARPAVRRHPLYGGPADERPLVYVTFGSVAPSMEFFPGLYRAAIDALAAPAAAPARDRRARPRPGRRWGRCRPTCASSAGCRRPTSCRTWRRWSATAGRAP